MKYKARSVDFPPEDQGLRQNVIGWQLACAALGHEEHKLHPEHAETLKKRVKTDNVEFENVLKLKGREVAVIDKEFFYRKAFAIAVEQDDLVAKLNPRFERLMLESSKTAAKDVVSNMIRSIDKKHGGNLRGLKVGKTPASRESLQKVFFFSD